MITAQGIIRRHHFLPTHSPATCSQPLLLTLSEDWGSHMTHELIRGRQKFSGLRILTTFLYIKCQSLLVNLLGRQPHGCVVISVRSLRRFWSMPWATKLHPHCNQPLADLPSGFSSQSSHSCLLSPHNPDLWEIPLRNMNTHTYCKCTCMHTHLYTERDRVSKQVRKREVTWQVTPFLFT